MVRTIAGEHFYGPKGLDAVEVPPRLGAVCVVSCRRGDGREVAIGVAEREPGPTWRDIADEPQRRAWREACNGSLRAWCRLSGPSVEDGTERRGLAAAIRSRLDRSGR